MNNSDIEIYFNSHPDATIKEYLDYVKAKDIEKKEYESEREKNRIEWYKALEGRCFIITFHSRAHIVLKVTEWPNAEFKNKYLCYNIYIDPNYIIKEENREVNRYWFKNPYEKPYYGQNEGSCKEISEEMYNEIVEKCEKVEEIINSINIKNL